jgi:dihydrofolate reductase
MKKILYMAVSLDGRTTFNDDDTSWVEPADIERMDALMIQCGVMLMGRKTYESFGNDLPTDQALQVVLTRNKALLSKKQENVWFTDDSCEKIFAELEAKGFESVMIAGGCNLNTELLRNNMIDEIRLIIKPVILGSGKSLFDGDFALQHWTQIKYETLPDGAIECRFVKHL